MNDVLQKVWDDAPKEIQKADYCFYVGKGYKDVPKKFKRKLVVVVYIIDDFAVYYAPRILI
jgi:hypothetical protein